MTAVSSAWTDHVQSDRAPLVWRAERDDRPQVLHAGGWQEVDLHVPTGPLRPSCGRWVTSPRDFAERYAAGTARLVRYVGLVVDADATEWADEVLAASSLANADPAA